MKLENNFGHLRMKLIIRCRTSRTECKSTVENIDIFCNSEPVTCLEPLEPTANGRGSLAPALPWGAPVSPAKGDGGQEGLTELPNAHR